MTDFGHRLRELRRGRSVGLRSIEKYVGLARSGLSQIERGRQRSISPTTLLLCAYYIRLSAKEFRELMDLLPPENWLLVERLIEAAAHYHQLRRLPDEYPGTTPGNLAGQNQQPDG